MLAEPADRDWGGRSAYFADPEGERLGDRLGPGLDLRRARRPDLAVLITR